MNIVFLLITAIAGVAVAVQAAANSGLGHRVGLGTALMINSVIVIVASIALWVWDGSPQGRWPLQTVEETMEKLHQRGSLLGHQSVQLSKQGAHVTKTKVPIPETLPPGLPPQ